MRDPVDKSHKLCVNCDADYYPVRLLLLLCPASCIFSSLQMSTTEKQFPPKSKYGGPPTMMGPWPCTAGQRSKQGVSWPCASTASAEHSV